MFPLALQELARVIDGQLVLADLPPIDGDLQSVQSIHFDIDQLESNGIYWDLSSSREESFGLPELAYAKGAAGVITSYAPGSPWAGRYSLIVDDCQLALQKFAHHLCQSKKKQSLLLGPSLYNPGNITALQATLKIPASTGAKENHVPLGELTHLGSSGDVQLSALQTLDSPSLYATVLLSAADFIVFGRADADHIRQAPPSTFHTLTQFLQPTATILYCDLSLEPPTGWLSEVGAPTWSQTCAAAGISYLRIGSDHHADFQVRPVSSTDPSQVMRIGCDWTPLSTGPYDQIIAQATALGAATVINHTRAA